MGAVDCIVTKAGPATIAEATTRGLPIMLSAFSPGQEVSKGGLIAVFRPSVLSLYVRRVLGCIWSLHRNIGNKMSAVTMSVVTALMVAIIVTAADSYSTCSLFCPQEGNVPYVVEGGFGSFGKKPAKIADTISNWLRDDELLARMSVKAQKASRPMVRLSNTSSALKTQNARLHNNPRYSLMLSRVTAISSYRSGRQPTT